MGTTDRVKLAVHIQDGHHWPGEAGNLHPGWAPHTHTGSLSFFFFNLSLFPHSLFLLFYFQNRHSLQTDAVCYIKKQERNRKKMKTLFHANIWTWPDDSDRQRAPRAASWQAASEEITPRFPCSSLVYMWWTGVEEHKWRGQIAAASHVQVLGIAELGFFSSS